MNLHEKKDQIVMSACRSDIETLRKVSRELDKLCVSTAWECVSHIQGHLDELASDIVDIQESITNPEEYLEQFQVRDGIVVNKRNREN